MNQKDKEILDELEKEEKAKIFYAVLIGLASICFMSAYVMFLYDPYNPTGVVLKGDIVGVYKPDSDNVVRNVKLSVKLENGPTVQISGARIGPIKIKNQVLVREVETKYFKRKRYIFIKYLEKSKSA